MVNMKYVLEITLIDTIDHYISHHLNTDKMVYYTVSDGEILYYADKNNIFNGTNINIYYIETKYQGQGILKNYLDYVTGKDFIKVVRIMSITSDILYSYLLRAVNRGIKWKKDGEDFIWMNYP